MEELPLYEYTIEILIDEECCLFNQSLWYKGAEDGNTWMFQVGVKMTNVYMGE